jgi:hypothetical protein
MDTTGVHCSTSRGGVSVGKWTHMLSPFQTEVAQLFYSLPESKHFLLAGGAAFLAHRISSRPTRDLDFFTWPGHASVDATVAEFLGDFPVWFHATADAGFIHQDRLNYYMNYYMLTSLR